MMSPKASSYALLIALTLIAASGCAASAGGLSGAAAPLPAGEAAAYVVSADGITDAAGGAQPDANIKCPPFCPKPGPLFAGRVVFVSDRSGERRLYVGDAANPAGKPLALDGTGQQEIRSPVWSPDGKVIAYLMTDVVTPVGQTDQVSAIILVDGAGKPLTWFHAPSLGLGNPRLDYLVWSNAGDRLCFSYYDDWSARGLACLEFPGYKLGGAYPFNQTQVRRLVEPGGQAADGAVIAPSESSFGTGDGTLYFSADTAASRGRLYRLAVPPVSAPVPVQPATTAELVKDASGAPIDLVFAPSFGVQNGKASLLLNSECWRIPGSGCQDEELLRLDLASGTVKRLTSLPGHQVGSYGRGAGGAYVLQTSDSAAGKGAIALASAADQIFPAPFGDSGNQWNDFAPDWWVK